MSTSKEQNYSRYDKGPVLYRIYGRNVDFKHYQGNPMPEWDALPENIRKAWQIAAEEYEVVMFGCNA